jgi:prepilin-type N-terminal cleavage/methylation domain-containing protein
MKRNPKAAGRAGVRRRAAGFTLPEVMTAMVVMVIVIGGIAAIYMASMRMWYRGAAENYAQQNASWAVQRIVPEVREGLSVTTAGSPYESVCIVVRLPSKVYDSGEGTYLNEVATDAYGDPYLVPGGWAMYYRGTEYGSISLEGDRLWRFYIGSDGMTYKQQVVAENIVDNPPDGTGNPKPMFIYWPDIYRLESVEITVTTHEEIGHRVAEATMRGEVNLRNN